MKKKLVVGLVAVVLLAGLLSPYVSIHIGSDALILQARTDTGHKYTPLLWHIFE